MQLKLNIVVDKKYYKSDLIRNGRVVSKFFETLSRNVFNQSYKFWKLNEALTGEHDIPILHGERNLYSTFAVAIDKITPVHLSEWTFNQTDHKSIENNRRVDFWCLNRDGDSGVPINYFVEVKKGWYCLNKNSNDEFQKTLSEDIKSLFSQTISLKKISPKWADIDDVFLGILVIHGYYRDGNEFYDENHVRENIYTLMDKRINFQLITSTWIIPENMSAQWDKDKLRFITIAGIVLTKKR